MIQSYDRFRLQQEDEQDPYKGYSDSNAAQAEVPQETQPQEPTAIKPYEPPKTETKPSEPKAVPETRIPVAPVKTFAQMEADGEARPPMPTSSIPEPIQAYQPPSGSMGSGEPKPLPIPPTTERAFVPQVPDETGMVGSNAPPAPPAQPPAPPPAPPQPPAQPPVAPTPAVADETGLVGSNAPAVPPQVQSQVQPPAPVPVAPPQPATPDWLLSLLQGGAQGTTQSDLQKATSAKALDRLNSASPYDSQAVRDEYNYLAGNIDDDYAMQQRAADESFAGRGLYGSAGKDFHSGRLSDLNVGKRSAKTALAQDLANKFATTKGQYDATAVDQANNIGQTEQSNKFGYINDLMGYGNDAFSHDLATAQFQQGVNESEQDYILRLLQLGYGV